MFSVHHNFRQAVMALDLFLLPLPAQANDAESLYDSKGIPLGTSRMMVIRASTLQYDLVELYLYRARNSSAQMALASVLIAALHKMFTSLGWLQT